MRRLFTGLAALAIAQTAQAQSTITLDTFDLDGTGTAPVTGESERMRDCLLNGGDCADSDYSSGAELTMEDVVALGVVKREEFEASPTLSETAPLPSIDLEILFAYDSDRLTPEAMRTLADLSEALRDPRLSTAKLLFVGHTDAVGSAAYNLDLSRRRAEAVARHVVATTQVPPSRVDAVGMGFSRLKNSFDPSAPENRRVQVVLVPGA